jgi:O-antigen/teichoic acid export membrane protein
MLTGPWIFKTVFGNKWEIAGTFSQILAPLFFLKFLANPLSYMYFIVGKQKEDFYGHIAMIILIIIAFSISNYFSKSIYLALIAYSISYCIIYVFYLIRTYQFSNSKPIIF